MFSVYYSNQSKPHWCNLLLLILYLRSHVYYWFPYVTYLMHFLLCAHNIGIMIVWCLLWRRCKVYSSQQRNILLCLCLITRNFTIKVQISLWSWWFIVFSIEWPKLGYVDNCDGYFEEDKQVIIGGRKCIQMKVFSSLSIIIEMWCSKYRFNWDHKVLIKSLIGIVIW